MRATLDVEKMAKGTGNADAQKDVVRVVLE